jgi:hypothetical protein
MKINKKQSTNMKIYEFTYSGGETDWVFAPSKKAAKKFYIAFTSCGDLTETEVKKVPKNKWSEMYLLDIENTEPDEDEEYNEEDYSCGYKIIESFVDYAKKNSVIDMIATTDF